MAAPYELRGWRKILLIQELALDARPQTELAEAFGVTQPAVSQFATRHRERIAKARSEIENSVAGLWISDKSARLAELEDLVERLNEEIEGADARTLPRLGLVKCRALRNAAEELGQLAPRQYDVTARVRYEVVGVDLEALR